jgi:hypothetical protein
MTDDAMAYTRSQLLAIYDSDASVSPRQRSGSTAGNQRTALGGHRPVHRINNLCSGDT